MKKTGIILIFIVLINISVMYANTPIVIKTTPTNRDVIESKALKKIKIFFTHPLNVKTINIFTVIFQKFNGEKLFGKVDYNSANSCIVFTPALQLAKNSKSASDFKTKANEIIEKDLSFREQAINQFGLSLEEELFYFGRPMFKSLEYFFVKE